LTVNRRDIVAAAVGLIGMVNDSWEVGVAGVFPLSDAENRVFDSQVKVSLIRRR
jgi:hypothetical protein